MRYPSSDSKKHIVQMSEVSTFIRGEYLEETNTNDLQETNAGKLLVGKLNYM